MGTLVKGGLLRPLDPYAQAFGWDYRYSKLLLDLNRFSSDGEDVRRRATSTGCRRWARSSASSTTRTRCPQPPKTLADFEQSLAEAKQAGRHPDPVRQPRQVARHPRVRDRARPDRRQAGRARLRLRPRRRVVRHARVHRRGRRKLQEWADKGYFTPDFNGTGYDPAWQQFAKGKGRFLIAGTWLVADLDKQMGDNVGFMLMPGAEARRRPGRARRREPAVRDHVEVQATPTSPPPTSTSSPTPNAAKVLAETGNLPAMPVDRAAVPHGAAGRRVRRVEDAQRRRRPDPVPGLHDADVLRRHQRRDPAAAGRQGRPGRSSPAQDMPSSPSPSDSTGRRPAGRGDRGDAQAVGASAAAGRAAARRLPVPRCRRSPSSRCFVLRAARARGWLSLFEWDGITPGTWVGLDNYGDVVSDPALRRGVRPLAGADRLLRACCRSRSGCCSPALLARIRVRGLTALPHDPVPAAGGRDGRRRGDVADDLRPRRRARSTRCCARVGLGGLAQSWLGDFDRALPAVGLIGTWVDVRPGMVLLTAGVQKIPQSLYDAARVDGAGRGARVLRGHAAGAARRDRASR